MRKYKVQSQQIRASNSSRKRHSAAVMIDGSSTYFYPLSTLAVRRPSLICSKLCSNPAYFSNLERRMEPTGMRRIRIWASDAKGAPSMARARFQARGSV